MSFGAEIRRLRVKRGWSIARLAVAMGWGGHGWISAVENETRPAYPDETLHRVLRTILRVDDLPLSAWSYWRHRAAWARMLRHYPVDGPPEGREALEAMGVAFAQGKLTAERWGMIMSAISQSKERP